MWRYFLIPLANQSVVLCIKGTLEELKKNNSKSAWNCIPNFAARLSVPFYCVTNWTAPRCWNNMKGFFFLSQAFLFLVCSHNKGMPQCYVINWQAGLINTANNIMVHALISKNTFPALFNYVCVWRSSLLSSLLPHDLMIVFFGLLTCVGVV